MTVAPGPRTTGTHGTHRTSRTEGRDGISIVSAFVNTVHKLVIKTRMGRPTHGEFVRT